MNYQAKKRFGQNFLVDYNIIQQILFNLQLSKQQHWLEIGPGLGAITKYLVEHVNELAAVEIDTDLQSKLLQQFNSYKNFTLYSTDILKLNIADLVKQSKLHIFGNLPYNISTEILFYLIPSIDIIESCYFMLQTEVANRLLAVPGNKNYGRLSIFIQCYFYVENLLLVPPTSFEPQPKVNSSFVKLTPYNSTNKPYNINNFDIFKKLVTQAFRHRRKTLSNNLKELVSNELMQQLSIDPKLRPEAITIKQFAELANHLAS